MEEEENLLTLLVPIFKDGCTTEQIDLLASTLRKKKRISEDGKLSVLRSDGDEKIEKLFEAVQATNKTGWKETIVNFIEFKLDRSDVSSIIEECLDRDGNEHIKWILRSWRELSEVESEVKHLSSELANLELPQEKWLLEFSAYIANPEANHQLVDKIVNLLQEKLSINQSSEVSIPSTFSSFVSLNLEDISDDGSAALEPLLPMLEDCLKPSEVYKMGNKLFKSHYLLKDKWNQMAADDSTLIRVSTFIEILKTEFGSKGMKLFVDSISHSDVPELEEVVKNYLTQENERLTWFLTNWENIKQRQGILETYKDEFPALQSFDSNNPSSLLCVAYSVALLNENASKKFVDFMKDVCASDSSLHALRPYQERLESTSREKEPTVATSRPYQIPIDTSGRTVSTQLDHRTNLSVTPVPGPRKQNPIPQESTVAASTASPHLTPIASSGRIVSTQLDHRTNPRPGQNRFPENQPDPMFRTQDVIAQEPTVAASTASPYQTPIDTSGIPVSTQPDYGKNQSVTPVPGPRNQNPIRQEPTVAASIASPYQTPIDTSGITVSTQPDHATNQYVAPVPGPRNQNPIRQEPTVAAGTASPHLTPIDISGRTVSTQPDYGTNLHPGQNRFSESQPDPMFRTQDVIVQEPTVAASTASPYQTPINSSGRTVSTQPDHARNQSVTPVSGPRKQNLIRQELTVAAGTASPHLTPIDISGRTVSTQPDYGTNLHPGQNRFSESQPDPMFRTQDVIVQASASGAPTPTPRKSKLRQPSPTTTVEQARDFDRSSGDHGQISDAERQQTHAHLDHGQVHRLAGGQQLSQLHGTRPQSLSGAFYDGKNKSENVYGNLQSLPEQQQLEQLTNQYSNENPPVEKSPRGPIVSPTRSDHYQHSVKQRHTEEPQTPLGQTLQQTFPSGGIQAQQSNRSIQQKPFQNTEEKHFVSQYSLTVRDQAKGRQTSSRTSDDRHSFDQHHMRSGHPMNEPTPHLQPSSQVRLPHSTATYEQIHAPRFDNPVVDYGQTDEVRQQQTHHSDRGQAQHLRRVRQEINFPTNTSSYHTDLGFNQTYQQQAPYASPVLQRRPYSSSPSHQNYQSVEEQNMKEQELQTTTSSLQRQGVGRNPVIRQKNNPQSQTSPIYNRETSDHQDKEQTYILTQGVSRQQSATVQQQMQYPGQNDRMPFKASVPTIYPSLPKGEHDSLQQNLSSPDRSDLYSFQQPQNQPTHQGMLDPQHVSPSETQINISKYSVGYNPNYYTDQRNEWQAEQDNRQMPFPSDEKVDSEDEFKDTEEEWRNSEDEDAFVLSAENFQPEVSQNISVNEIEKEVIDYKKLSSKGFYMLDFRVMLSDYKLKEEETLYLLHLTTEGGSYIPMEYDAESGSYFYSMKLYKSVEMTLYKYVILGNQYHNKKNKKWENLPFDLYYDNGDCMNRAVYPYTEQVHSGHAILFDVVTIKSTTVEKYKKTYQKDVSKFLPSSFRLKISESERRGEDLQWFLQMYWQWIINNDRGIVIKQDRNRSVTRIYAGKSMELSIERYVTQLIHELNGQQDSQSHLRRVLCMFVLMLAMETRGLMIEKNSFQAIVCNGLSLHDIDETCLSLLFWHLSQLHDSWKLQKYSNIGGSVKNIFEAIFKKLSNVPQIVLVLPLYRVLLSAVESQDLKERYIELPSPKTVTWRKVATYFTSKNFQKEFQSMSKQISLLADRFPGVCEKFYFCLTCETISTLLSSQPPCKALLSSTTMLRIAVAFWHQLAHGKKVHEEAFYAIINFIAQYFEKENKFLQENGQPNETYTKFCSFWKVWIKDTLTHMVDYMYHYPKKFQSKYITTSFSLIALVMEAITNMQQFQSTRSIATGLQDIYNQLHYTVKWMISSSNKGKPKASDIMFWNMLVNLNWPSKTFADSWIAECKTSITEVIPKKFDNSTQNLLEFYANNFEEMRPDPLVHKWITDVVLDHVTRSLYNNSSFPRWSPFTLYHNPNTLRLCESIVNKQWEELMEKQTNQTLDNYMFLEFLESWNQTAIFFNILCNKDMYHQIEKRAKRNLSVMQDHVNSIAGNIHDGSISPAALAKLSKVQTGFLECFDALQVVSSATDALYERDVLKNKIQYRLAQLEAFYEAKQPIEALVNFAYSLEKECSLIIDFKGLSELSTADINQLPLFQLVKCTTDDGFHWGGQQLLHDVIFFGIPDILKGYVMDLQRTKALESTVFQNNLRDAAMDSGEKKLTIYEILHNAWCSAVNMTLDTVNQIETGEIKLQKFEEIFQDLLKESGSVMDFLKEEITRIINISINLNLGRKTFSPECLDQRLKQVSIYLKLQENSRLVTCLNSIKEKFNLTGNFDALSLPMETSKSSTNRTLNSVTREMFAANKMLQKVSRQEVIVLEKFVEGDELIDWLKANMENLGEAQTMTDLAMISAGEASMDVAKVSCFLSAVMGFAPLIFDLPKTAGLKHLLGCCGEVWSNVDRDPQLLQKWCSTCEEVAWLSSVKDSHGSIEELSLTLAQKINARGIYTIGGEVDATPSVDNCLTLQLTTDEKGIQEKKVMKLSDLRDLQSRLTLIAGEADQGQSDVKRFIDVFSSVENLTKAYVKLKLSGCLLFSSWSATISCTTERIPQRSTVGVSFDEKCPIISSEEEIVEELKKLTKVLNDSHEKWMAYLNKKRNKHYYLNHYNIQQLTYLCKQLATVEMEDFPDKVYTLLASVNDKITFKIILDHLDDITKINDEEDGEYHSMEGDDHTETQIEKKKKVVQRLVQENVDEEVAKAAAQSVKGLDLDDCYLWTLAHSNDGKVIKELVQNFNAEIGFQTKKGDINAFKDVINERLNLTLEDVIARIQDEQQKRGDETSVVAVKTVCERYFKKTSVTSLQNCLSVEHLGKFLSKLGSIVNEGNLPKRAYPEPLQPGKPNLIITQPTKMWETILSIYMESEEQPLPSGSEVLVCSPSTSAEDVELLLRRAIGASADKGERIFCLACADELSFNASKRAEEIFKLLNQMTEKNGNYRLIILTSSFHHRVTACFDEHQVDVKFTGNDSALQKYINDHLCTKHLNKPTAATVDHDKSSVRVVRSKRAGMGKSLYISRRREDLQDGYKNIHWNSSTIRFLEKDVNTDDVVDTLYKSITAEEVCNVAPHFVHIDITPSVHNGVYKFLFDLIILGTIKSSSGDVWRHQPQHFYMLEYTIPSTKGSPSFSSLLNLLPCITCLSPLEVKTYLRNNPNQQSPINEVLMDETLLESDMYQRPLQYLTKYSTKENLDAFEYDPKNKINTSSECLQTLLRFCNIKDPSWSELSHFSRFFNVQLQDCEQSIFYNVASVEDAGMQGFKKFVIRFMIRMSQDFATPSLNMGNAESENIEYNIKDEEEYQGNDLFELHQLRRKWESECHPYVFFNDDHASMSFIDFNVTEEGHLCHPKTEKIVEKHLMHYKLVEDLMSYEVPLQQNFDLLTRSKKLDTLCKVFGVNSVCDPDPTYELTTDNVLKMLAIHMRFRCGIPVVVMGETGCGKTRMVEFMSKLKRGNKNIRNMVVVKVHGGITVSVIQERVLEAVKLAEENKAKGNLETILFLDEANTTEAIYAIKEIVCDGTVHGEKFLNTGLKIVAACNPYRKHSEEELAAMEKSGLGFNVKTENVAEKFAGIAMRKLVYRVVCLPPSMQPLVWDFGKLSDDTEAIYIKQMVAKLQNDINDDENLPNLSVEMAPLLSDTLTASQNYMRKEKNACSFVSLRDVERTLQSFLWFYKHMNMLGPMIEQEKKRKKRRTGKDRNLDAAVQALIHALGICYHATLNDRAPFRKVLSNVIREATGRHQFTEQDILNEIIACQNVFINAIKLEKDIAKNEALRENVFMIVVCAEMRIPLFLIGKPGSSKSLAKTIVTDAMQGRMSKHRLFKELKKIQVLSFQCSAISDAVGIETVFSQCAQLQKTQDLNSYVATVVLDEIGLAEDSPKMPLKVLHPLLENASTNSQLVSEPYCKVGFVGISNWALDPAKMNRGIFVTRGEPSPDDLQTTAEAIFQSDQRKIKKHHHVIRAVTDAYLEVCKEQEKEFFGLRDYYSLLKMIFATTSKKTLIDFQDVAYAVLRNFNGYTQDASKTFFKHLINVFPHIYDVRASLKDLVLANLHSESRFLLLLTKQYSAVSLLPKISSKDYQVIFGSSFPHDNDYTEVCRNINRIKVCMETGRAVVLLNLRDLYESLYDALNQHYITFSGQRFVDLGLGGHRVKCRIATGFRLIVIEEKEIVYNDFATPLINRLEKYVFEIENVLSDPQMMLVQRLKEWVINFSQGKTHQSKSFKQEDAFAGLQDETYASALLCSNASHEDPFEAAKIALLQTASLEGVCRLSQSALQEDAEKLRQIYMENQEHNTLWKMLNKELSQKRSISVFEVISYSRVLNETDKEKLEKQLELEENSIMLMTLEQFHTEHDYSEKLDGFFKHCEIGTENTDNDEKLSKSYVLLIQCGQAHLYRSLIACAKYSALNKIKEFKRSRRVNCSIIVAFIFTVERPAATSKNTATFSSLHSQDCMSVYVDELRPRQNNIASVDVLWNLSISEIISRGFLEKDRDNAIIDVTRLMQDSIPSAMARLKNQCDIQGRNRVRILNNLSFKNGDLSEIFLKIIFEKISQMIKSTEKHSKESWIVKEACTADHLQEGGSFRNTLWLGLRKVFSLALAKLVSVVDMDNNLNLIENSENGENTKFFDLWLRMFSSKDLCKDLQLSFLTQDMGFVVQQKDDFSCNFPFFRATFEQLCKQWAIVDEQWKEENKTETFVEKIAGSFLEEFLRLATEKGNVDAIQRFIHDMSHFMYQSYSKNENLKTELEIVQKCVFTFFSQFKKSPQSLNCNALIAIFVIFMQSKDKLYQFAEIMSICPEILCDSGIWVEEQEKCSEFVVHQLAFSSLIQKLERDADNLGDLNSCKNWKSIVNKTKYIVDVLLPDASDEKKESWTQILFVEIFLDQLIPTSADTTTAQNYLTVLAQHARRLWKGAVANKSLSNFMFLNIVTNILKECINKIKLNLLCSWKDAVCKAGRHELKDPMLLPCEKHYICSHCASTSDGDISCPVCRVKVSKSEELKPMRLQHQERKKLDEFSAACTSFFLEYLSVFCFPLSESVTESSQGPPPDENITHALESLVICDNKTKNLSLTAKNFDENPTARSYILQLLLRCDSSLVETQLDKHFQTMADALHNKGILMDIYIRCKQDILKSRCDNFEEETENNVIHAYQLLTESIETPMDSMTQIQHLELSTKLQYATKVAVQCIIKTESKKCQSKNVLDFIQEICEICKNPKFFILRHYIVKTLCRRYGMDAFNLLQENNNFKSIIPEDLFLQAENEDYYLQADLFTLCGETYIKVKTQLLTVTQESDFDNIFQQFIHEIQQSADSVFQILLALSVWTSQDDAQTLLKRQAYDYLTGRLQTHLSQKPYKHVFNDVAKQTIQDFEFKGPTTTAMQYKLKEILTMLYVTLFSSEKGLITDLAGFVKNPQQIRKMFLPTMPQSNFFDVKKVMMQETWGGNVTPKAFLCPDGHIYFIGDCTRANERGICPECHKPIGGQDYDVLEEGNVSGEITEESQAGYKLKAADKRTPVAPERKLTKLSVCATRVCLHATLLLAARKSNHIRRLLNIKGNQQDVYHFLLQHMLRDLDELSECLGRSMDDTLIVMHQIFHNIRRASKTAGAQRKFNLKTMDAREEWEAEFQRCYLSLVFRDVDAVINEAQNAMIAAGKATELHQLVYEIAPDKELPDGVVEWDCPNLWKYRIHVDMQHLRQKLEGVDGTVAGEGAALKAILTSKNSHLLQHLPQIFTLQAILITKYKQKIDMDDADKITLQQYMEDEDTWSEQLQSNVELYITTFNKTRHFLGSCNRYNAPFEYFNEDMNFESPISMCLPSKRGRGRSALLFSEHLIDQQNKLLQKCRELTIPSFEFATMDVARCSKIDVICINEKRDLMPLVLANAQYETTPGKSGNKHNISYNLGLLEKKVLEKFILRKATLKRETIPLMQYPQDVGLAKDYETVRGNTEHKQVRLPVRMCQDLDALSDNVMTSSICEAVRTIALVVQFIAKLGADPDQTICDYAEGELLLPSDETEMIPKSAQICHSLALYERLSWHRSRRLIANGRNPFENVNATFEEIQDKPLIDNLNEELKAMNVQRLQLELNALLMVGPEMNPVWRLGEEVLNEYLDQKYDDVDNSWCKKLPEEILFKHAVHVFTISMKHLVDTI